MESRGWPGIEPGQYASTPGRRKQCEGKLRAPQHLVRHAQGVHNIEGEKNYKAYMKPEYFDAPLAPLGWQQVDNLRQYVHASGLHKRIELVVTSPLLRTMQTAVGVFGGEGYMDRMDALPLMVANAGNSYRSAISSLNCPPIMAVEFCREHLGVHPCDKRRTIQEYQLLFPAIDFSVIETDEDTMWKADVRETKAEVAARGMKLCTRKEKEIAVVTHSGFLLHTLSQFGNDCHPLMKDNMCKRMTGSQEPITNYPGKIPNGSDIPSDANDENGRDNANEQNHS
ncbi:hypothetical protein Cgig2_019476 [Carnegiea gigantea]|uniref:Phosphoglycerate mutase-like protein 1 n=1 Tax=Carnegiea gigantea TaxID=171969 RepID=A0A9Q1KRR8_9CARY|nr:hypothetical protein Cgig2_019476 [Carnegiea gigantea]